MDYTLHGVKLDVFLAPFAYFAVKKEDLTAKYARIAKTAFMPFLVLHPRLFSRLSPTAQSKDCDSVDKNLIDNLIYKNKTTSVAMSNKKTNLILSWENEVDFFVDSRATEVVLLMVNEV